MKNNIFAALSEKPFLYLWIGEIITQIPTHLFNFFLILIVFNLTKSNTAVSGVVLSFTIPAIIFGSIAGVYVDRWDKKKVMITTNVIRAILIIILIFFLNNLFAIYLISLLVTILVQFFIPAETPMIPLVVREKNLLSANALFGMAIFGSLLIAYVISGPFLLYLGEERTLIFIAGMLLLGAVFISCVKVKDVKIKTPTKVNSRANFMIDIKYALSLMSKTKEVSSSLLLLSLSQVLVLIIATVAPGYANQILKINIEEFPLLFAAPAALGMVAGAILVVNKFHNHSKQTIINIGIIVSGAAMLLLPFGSRVASRDFTHTLNSFLPKFLDINILSFMMVLAFILGVANSLVFVPANTILQENTTDDVRGKIYGFLNSIIGAVSLLPIIIVGGLSDLVGVGNVIIGIGIFILTFGIIKISLNKI